MKIIITNDTIYGWASGASVVGGAERQQWLLARALAATGWSVTVGVREALEARERRTIDGVEFLGIGRGYTGIGRDHIHRVWYRFLSSEQPDWWYWRCANHLWGSAVEVAKLAGVRTIFAAGVDSDVQPRRALFQRPHWWPLYAWGLSRTDRIFVQHAGQLAELAPRWRLYRLSQLLTAHFGTVGLHDRTHAGRRDVEQYWGAAKDADGRVWSNLPARTHRPDPLYRIRHVERLGLRHMEKARLGDRAAR